MQQRLLEATVSTLVEHGYRGTTTLEVQRRAGVSRGALLHHFTSRADLILAAVDHLTRERLAALHALATQAPPQRAKRVTWAVRVLWSSFEGALFSASPELWLAARSDADLRDTLLPQERLLGKEIEELAADLFGAKLASHPKFRSTTSVLIDSMRGAATRSALRADRSDERLIAGWVQLVEERLR